MGEKTNAPDPAAGGAQVAEGPPSPYEGEAGRQGLTPEGQQVYDGLRGAGYSPAQTRDVIDGLPDREGPGDPATAPDTPSPPPGGPAGEQTRPVGEKTNSPDPSAGGATVAEGPTTTDGPATGAGDPPTTTSATPSVTCTHCGEPRPDDPSNCAHCGLPPAAPSAPASNVPGIPCRNCGEPRPSPLLKCPHCGLP
jgi:hypothetical protein